MRTKASILIASSRGLGRNTFCASVILEASWKRLRASSRYVAQSWRRAEVSFGLVGVPEVVLRLWRRLWVLFGCVSVASWKCRQPSLGVWSPWAFLALSCKRLEGSLGTSCELLRFHGRIRGRSVVWWRRLGGSLESGRGWVLLGALWKHMRSRLGISGHVLGLHEEEQ